MKESGRIIPGCGNHDAFAGLCIVMFNRQKGIPSLAEEVLIEPPGAVEGPPSAGVPGLICTVPTRPAFQKGCSHFVIRTQADNLRDENI